MYTCAREAILEKDTIRVMQPAKLPDISPLPTLKGTKQHKQTPSEAHQGYLSANPTLA